jgi:valine dehydrogenase (NAD+)
MAVLADGHEDVLFHQASAPGLTCIIAVHDTRLGPGLGGTRMRPYPNEAAALADVLALARAMSYKNALAGLPHGGAKAVILGDPATDKSPALLRAYGEAVETLGGRYVTACDVGTTVADMDIVAERCQYVTGRSPDRGGAGDSGVLTAFGVLRGITACAAWRWGSPSLAGRRVGVAGLGKVGARLVGLLLEEGASVVVGDVDAAAIARVVAAHPEVETVADPADLLTTPLDVYSPNALGGILTSSVVAGLAAEVVCGGANNQLGDAGADAALAARGILYAPDYLVNAGGVIAVADERRGYDPARARATAAGIHDTALEVFATARDAGITPLAAADRVAEARMAAGTWQWHGTRNTP